jgi:hypothetical protein
MDDVVKKPAKSLYLSGKFDIVATGKVRFFNCKSLMRNITFNFYVRETVSEND